MTPNREDIQDFARRHPLSTLYAIALGLSLRTLALVTTLGALGILGYFTSLSFLQTASLRTVPIELMTQRQYLDAIESCAVLFQSSRSNEKGQGPRVDYEQGMVFRLTFRGRGSLLATENEAYLEEIQLIVLITRQVENRKNIEANVFLASAKQTPWPISDNRIPNDLMYKPFEPAQLPKLDQFAGAFSTFLSRCVKSPASKT